MSRQRWAAGLLVIPITAAIAILVIAVGARRATGDSPAPSGAEKAEAAAGDGARPAPRKIPDKPGQIEVPPPPFTEGVFPCSDCHNADRLPDPTPRELSEHDFKLEHDAEHRWCLDCHDVRDYDKLHLTGGQQIDFTQSYQLCGQCHGDKYRDWRVGVHGRRTGEWNGKKSYLLCVHCHNPHSPRFKPIKPEPMPVRPEQLHRRGG